MDYQPWIEKYRPKHFKDIVLSEHNKNLLNNIIENNHFPNLLFYGPPGTGKTTTIINLIDKYHLKYNKNIKGLKIHLNASDDRGIDIIRNQINQFVNTKSLFGNGIKFVILDEVDYMTKNAQQALRCLIQNYSHNIRFCLICNYISKIEKSLQNEFISMCFCNLPKKNIKFFLNNIIKNENISISNKELNNIMIKFKSDLRSMINYLQSNRNTHMNLNNIVNNIELKNIVKIFKEKQTKKYIINKLNKTIKKYVDQNNISIQTFISNLIKYFINNNILIHKKSLTLFELIIHNTQINDHIILNFTLNHLFDLYKSL